MIEGGWLCCLLIAFCGLPFADTSFGPCHLNKHPRSIINNEFSFWQTYIFVEIAQHKHSVITYIHYLYAFTNGN